LGTRCMRGVCGDEGLGERPPFETPLRAGVGRGPPPLYSCGRNLCHFSGVGGICAIVLPVEWAARVPTYWGVFVCMCV
jgi:hypothetical protein